MDVQERYRRYEEWKMEDEAYLTQWTQGRHDSKHQPEIVRARLKSCNLVQSTETNSQHSLVALPVLRTIKCEVNKKSQKRELSNTKLSLGSATWLNDPAFEIQYFLVRSDRGTRLCLYHISINALSSLYRRYTVHQNS